MNGNNKYQRGKIYRIVCNTTGLQYYGSTCEDKLCKRLTRHKSDYNRFLKNKRGYVASFKILENNDYAIILVENFPCNNKDELLKIERYYIENNECVNKNIPSRISKEYHQDNKDQINERKKIYYDNNKERINARHKEWYEKNKDEANARHKEWNEKNKEKLKEYQIKYLAKKNLEKNNNIA